MKIKVRYQDLIALDKEIEAGLEDFTNRCKLLKEKVESGISLNNSSQKAWTGEAAVTFEKSLIEFLTNLKLVHDDLYSYKKYMRATVIGYRSRDVLSNLEKSHY